MAGNNQSRHDLQILPIVTSVSFQGRNWLGWPDVWIYEISQIWWKLLKYIGSPPASDHSGLLLESLWTLFSGWIWTLLEKNPTYIHMPVSDIVPTVHSFLARTGSMETRPITWTVSLSSQFVSCFISLFFCCCFGAVYKFDDFTSLFGAPTFI